MALTFDCVFAAEGREPSGFAASRRRADRKVPGHRVARSKAVIFFVAFRSAKERLVNALLRSKKRRCFVPRE